MWEYTNILGDASEKTMAAIKNRIFLVVQKFSDLKQSAGLDSSLGIDAWLNFFQ